ncbi:sel1 repeat family protein [Thioalkalicoccus limnaeus]|uniref:Sel1 repeat family protein n=1 Tax=Thioalkalicoccus limnaeus TaxID=120681 RepID=A0ABV4BCH0_9GAMM
MNEPRLAGKLLLALSLGMLTSGLGGCVTLPADGASPVARSASSPPDSVEDFVLCDCMLPGQVRQLGTMVTYLGPRRLVKTTPRDCAIRGGEYVVFDRANYASARDSLLPKAQQGNAVAQTHLGEIYERGLGLPARDYERAAEWYRKAAEQGHEAAQIRLGALYERGLGVPQDRQAALEWYRRASGLDQDEIVFRSTLEAERAAFRQEAAKRRSLQASLQRELTSTEHRLQAQTREKEVLQQEIQNLRRQLEGQAQARSPPGTGGGDAAEGLRRQLASLEQQLAAKDQALASAEAALSEQQSVLTSQLREAQSRADQLALEIEATQRQLDEASRELQQARGQLDEASSEGGRRIAELENQVARLEKLQASRKEQRDEVLGLLAQR